MLGRESGRGAVGFGLLLGSLGVGAVTGATFLPRIRSRFKAELLVAAGSLTFAAVAVGAATLRELYFLCPIMLVGGVAWICVLSTLTVAAQQASPPWVRARALAVYLIVFQAGIAGGSVLWGAVASSAGLSSAYFGIAVGLVLGAALALRLKLSADETVDHTPAHHWAEPSVAGEPPLDAGPIMIQVEYCVDPPQADAFRIALNELGRHRRRHGAEHWWLFQDTADPSRFVETWIEPTWAEHLRYHDRVSVTHREIEHRAHQYMRSGSAIMTRHFVAPVRRLSNNALAQAVEERTKG